MHEPRAVQLVACGNNWIEILCMTLSENPDPSPVPTVACEGCGGEAEVVIDGKGWCVDCFQARGSCCAGEFEK